MNLSLTHDETVELLGWLASFPYAQVCRHAVACEVLNMIDKRLPDMMMVGNLAEAFVSCNDEYALQILGLDK